MQLRGPECFCVRTTGCTKPEVGQGCLLKTFLIFFQGLSPKKKRQATQSGKVGFTTYQSLLYGTDPRGMYLQEPRMVPVHY